MKTRDFYFDLPEELIAQYPSQKREESRLMILDRKKHTIEHTTVSELPHYLSDTCIVFNDTKVRKARLFVTKKATEARVEFLFLDRIDDLRWKIMTSRSKKQREGDVYILPENIEAVIEKSLEGGEKLIITSKQIGDEYFDKYGHVPLPPYIRREDDKNDFDRYQTVYAKQTGSVAAPTAGLHFSNNLIDNLKKKNDLAFVTLHVGLGTFLPVRTENIEDHKMHYESYHVSEEAADKINLAKRHKKPVCAIGTTSVRTLESSYDSSKDAIVSGYGDTNLFIYPGYRFNVVDMLFTNFHTPGSSLLMLVSAFAGTDFIKHAYKIAIEKQYRFFSYGDAMLIL